MPGCDRSLGLAQRRKHSRDFSQARKVVLLCAPIRGAARSKSRGQKGGLLHPPMHCDAEQASNDHWPPPGAGSGECECPRSPEAQRPSAVTYSPA
eukprot:scaffold233907_cov36-Tisochrysis_lutea.AAC.6